MKQRKATIFELSEYMDEICCLGCGNCPLSDKGFGCLDFVRMYPEKQMKLYLNGMMKILKIKKMHLLIILLLRPVIYQVWIHVYT